MLNLVHFVTLQTLTNYILGISSTFLTQRCWWFSHQVMSDSCDPMDCGLPGSFVHPWDSPGKDIGVLQSPSPGDLPNPGIKPRSPALQADSLPTELQGKTFDTVKVSKTKLLRVRILVYFLA